MCLQPRHRLLCLAALAVVAAGSMSVPAERSSRDEVLAGLQRWLDETRELEASFEQTLVSGALGAGPAESGRLYVLRPGRMRWDYLRPERKIAIVDGDRTRLYVEEDRQLWEGTLEPSERVLPELLTSESKVWELFEIGTPAPSDRGVDGDYRLSLAPRSAAEAFEEIALTIRSPDFGIRSVEVLDAAGNRMRYEFSGIRRNEGLEKGIFEFEPPPGTEVVARP